MIAIRGGRLKQRPAAYTDYVVSAPARVSLAEFLAMEEEKPYLELIEGEIIPKAIAGPYHSAIVSRLIARLAVYLERTGEGFVDTELRHVSEADERVYLPDVSVTLKGRFPEGLGARGPVPVVPDFAIEVLSPDDRPSRVLERVEFYTSHGTRLLWIVDPELETVMVYREGEFQGVFRAPQTLDGSPVLREWSIGLADLFAAKERG
jgi:Uma2 family endonuclease